MDPAVNGALRRGVAMQVDRPDQRLDPLADGQIVGLSYERANGRAQGSLNVAIVALVELAGFTIIARLHRQEIRPKTTELPVQLESTVEIRGQVFVVSRAVESRQLFADPRHHLVALLDVLPVFAGRLGTEVH